MTVVSASFLCVVACAVVCHLPVVFAVCLKPVTQLNYHWITWAGPDFMKWAPGAADSQMQPAGHPKGMQTARWNLSAPSYSILGYRFPDTCSVAIVEPLPQTHRNATYHRVQMWH